MLNWRLIFLLSLFGLAMGFATVYFIPMMVEPFIWLAIFLICAYIIAKQAPGKYFLHGFLVCLLNCVWITTTHYVLFDDYMSFHKELSPEENTRMGALIMGPAIGIVSGLVLGLFSWIAARVMHKNKGGNSAPQDFKHLKGIIQQRKNLISALIRLWAG
jgi:uncharacterized membrane protein